MGTHVLVLVLGCWVLGPCGASSPLERPQLKSLVEPWVPVGQHLILQCLGPGPSFILHGNRSEPTVIAAKEFATFTIVATTAAAGVYTCSCQDPPGPPGPPSNPVEVVVTDPHLECPKLSLPPLQPLPVPQGTNVTVVCKGPPRAAIFRLYRGGPAGIVGQVGVSGGSASFSLQSPKQGAYVCTYSPEGGGVSLPSPPLLLLVEGEAATPKDPNWPGCSHWKGSY
ncbi:platelet glycoprotein VI-like [Ciconia boyciana]|uniref:platelet glycoprotein VI-like n=1 Tax=Ciconia boyciana TaxID=52775 RepID=UPI003B9EE99C